MITGQIQYLQGSKARKQLKTIVVYALVTNGFSTKVRLEDRRFQLRTAEKVALLVGLILSLIAAGNLRDLFTWLLILLLCFLVEQLIDAVACWVRFHKEYNGDWSYLKEKSLSRPIYRRINAWFGSCMLILIAYSGLLLRITFWISIGSIFVLGLILTAAVVENSKGQAGQINLGLGLWLRRGVSQVPSIFSTAAGMVAPGVLVSMIIGAISAEVWQFLNVLSWVKLSTVLFGVLVIAMLFSMAQLRGSLRKQITTAQFNRNPFDPAELYKAVIRCTPRRFAKKTSIDHFLAFPESYSSKWRERIQDRARYQLFHELDARANWHLWLGVLVLLPLLFVLMSASTFFLFSADIVSRWLDSGNSGVILTMSQDPRIKFAAVSSCLLALGFVSRYVQDIPRVLSKLHAENEVLTDWLTLLCAYECLAENEYQVIGAYEVRVGKIAKGFMDVPMILVPGNADEPLLERVAARMQTVSDYRFPCIFIMKADEFLKSIPDYFYLGGKSEEVTIEVLRENSKTATCWVWLEKRNGGTERQQFHAVDAAYRWVLSKSGEIDLRKSERNRLLTYGSTNDT